MFWVYFIIAVVLISVGSSAGLIISSYFHEFASNQFWLMTGAIAVAVITLAVILIKALIKTGHIRLEKINADVLKES